MTTLQGLAILVVEDQPIIAMDIVQALTDAGARVSRAIRLKEALAALKQAVPDAAILDHALGDGDASALCEELDKQGIPYVVYTGDPAITGPCSDAPQLQKPASNTTLIDKLREAISQKH